jgi:hypothetical protein
MIIQPSTSSQSLVLEQAERILTLAWLGPRGLSIWRTAKSGEVAWSGVAAANA